MYYFIVDNYINGDPKEYAIYIELVKPIVEAYGGEYLVRTDAVESWNERRKPDRCIVIRFPNREAIENCFASEQYKKIMSKRTEHVDSRAIIVPGMDIKCDPDMTNMII